MSRNEPVRVLPLWINGRAYLTMPLAFCDVREVRSGQILRRTPLCGAAEAATAIASAAKVLPIWSTKTRAERAGLLFAVGDSLASYASHFAGLIAEETGHEIDQAANEVAQAVALLRNTNDCLAPHGGVVAIVSDDLTPLSGPLGHAVPALLGGATVVFKPGPKAPSALLAFVELTALHGFPGGALNVLHGDLAAVEGLCAQPALDHLVFVGDRALALRIEAIAARYGRIVGSGKRHENERSAGEHGVSPA